jgi:hypothetical protein
MNLFFIIVNIFFNSTHNYGSRMSQSMHIFHGRHDDLGERPLQDFSLLTDCKRDIVGITII